MKTLQERRDAIDALDAEIIRLIGQRQIEVDGVIAAKKQDNISALQPARFEAVLQKCKQRAQDNDIDPELIETIWHALHEYFLVRERKVLGE